MADLETSGYYALGIPAYLAVIGIEDLVMRRRGKRVYGFANTIGNFSAGLGEVILGLFLGPYLIALYEYAYVHWRLVEWSEGSIIPWILAFFISDLGYYWYHRAGHKVAALWAIHGVHHQSDRFNISIAIRHPWFSDSYSAIFYAPLPLLGVSTTQFFLAISVISFYALTVHSQTFHRPGFYIFVTPRTHIVHHSRNPRYLGKNLGAMFTIWDRMFGTHVEIDPDDPPVLGTPGGYETHDGVKAQWIYFRDILASAAAGKTLRDKVMAFVGHPGWRPAGAKLPPSPAARAESTVSGAVKTYVLVQFAVTLALSAYVLWLREQHTFAVLALAAVAVLFSLSTIGGVLDGRPRAATWELARHVVFAVVGIALMGIAGYEVVGWGLVGAGAAGAAWVAAWWGRFAAPEATTPASEPPVPE